jgi:hypothetical protein
MGVALVKVKYNISNNKAAKFIRTMLRRNSAFAEPASPLAPGNRCEPFWGKRGKGNA